jgi:hypothetical protein
MPRWKPRPARRHPPRPEALERQDHPRRHGQGARLRPRQARRAHRRIERWQRASDGVAVTDDHVACDDDGRRSDRGHSGVHVAGAGERASGGSEERRLGVRVRAVRDAHRKARVRGGRRLRNNGCRDSRGSRLEPAAGCDTAAPANAASSVPAERLAHAVARHRCRSSGARRGARRHRARCTGRATRPVVEEDDGSVHARIADLAGSTFRPSSRRK